MDAFLSQWHWGQWFKEFIKYSSVPSFPSFIIEKICRAVNFLASDVIINWPRAMRMAWIKALIILQQQTSIRTTSSFSTEPIKNLAIWFTVWSQNNGNKFANHGRITHYGTVWDLKINTLLSFISLFTFLFIFRPLCFNTGHRYLGLLWCMCSVKTILHHINMKRKTRQSGNQGQNSWDVLCIDGLV